MNQEDKLERAFLHWLECYDIRPDQRYLHELRMLMHGILLENGKPSPFVIEGKKP